MSMMGVAAGCWWLVATLRSMSLFNNVRFVTTVAVLNILASSDWERYDQLRQDKVAFLK